MNPKQLLEQLGQNIESVEDMISNYRAVKGDAFANAALLLMDVHRLTQLLAKDDARTGLLQDNERHVLRLMSLRMIASISHRSMESILGDKADALFTEVQAAGKALAEKTLVFHRLPEDDTPG